MARCQAALAEVRVVMVEVLRRTKSEAELRRAERLAALVRDSAPGLGPAGVELLNRLGPPLAP